MHWKATGSDESPVVVGLLKPPVAPSAFDLSPFFSRTLTHRNTGYIFEGIHLYFSKNINGLNIVFVITKIGFSQLLTEMALRLPYLVKKVNSGVQLDQRWVECLCQVNA